jgi:hypothetical protein
MRWLAIAHHLPDRTRLRTPVLRNDRAGCEQLADTLAALAGVREVAVRPYTGSILVGHAESLPLAILVETVRGTLAIDRVLAAGEKPPAPAEIPTFSSIAKKLVCVVRELERDIRRSSEGAADLGVLATLGFFAAGAAEVVGSGELPLPPWFNLAWWGFRTFMTTEATAIESVE